MKTYFVFLAAAFLCCFSQAESLSDTCMNSKKEIAVQNSETIVKKISYTPDNKVTVESPNGKLSIDCKHADWDGSTLAWSEANREPKSTLFPDINRPKTFHEEREFPLRTEVIVAPINLGFAEYRTLLNGLKRGGSATTSIQIKDKNNPSGKSFYVVCSKKGFSVFSREGTVTTALYTNEEEPPVRDLPSSLPPPGGKFQDRVPVREPCHHSYVLDAKSGKVTVAAAPAAQQSPTIDDGDGKR